LLEVKYSFPERRAEDLACLEGGKALILKKKM